MIEIELILSGILIFLLIIIFILKRIRLSKHAKQIPKHQVASAIRKKEVTEFDSSTKAILQKKHPVPQDSMLKRHYLTQVHTLIEARHTACPADSTLKRHYQTMIDTEVEDYLTQITT